MDLFEAIAKRFSYRGEFTAQPVPQQDMEKILDAGIRAPSGYNKQGTYFIAVTDEKKRKELHEIFPHKGIGTAPLIVAVVTEPIVTANGMVFEMQDYAASVENILLAVTALGYATVWPDGECAANGRHDKLAKALEVPAGMTVRALLPIGVPVMGGRQAPRKAFGERVSINVFSRK